MPVSSYESDELIPAGDNYSGDVELLLIDYDAAQVAVTTDPHHLKLIKGESKTVSIIGVREDYTSFPIEYDDNTEFSGYDADIISIDNKGNISGKSIGSTYVTVKYKDYLCDLLVSVYKEGTNTETVKTQYED